MITKSKYILRIIQNKNGLLYSRSFSSSNTSTLVNSKYTLLNQQYSNSNRNIINTISNSGSNTGIKSIYNSPIHKLSYSSYSTTNRDSKQPIEKKDDELNEKPTEKDSVDVEDLLGGMEKEEEDLKQKEIESEEDLEKKQMLKDQEQARKQIKEKQEAEEEEEEEDKTTPTVTETEKKTGYSSQSDEAGQSEAGDQVQNSQAANLVYRTFTISFLVLSIIGIKRIVESFFSEGEDGSGGLLGDQYDHNQVIRDIYTNELKPYVDEGHSDFNKLVPKNTVYISERLAHFNKVGNVTSIMIPILQKKTHLLLAYINIDIVKEGQFVRVANFFVDAVNGFHYDFPLPSTKYDTQNPKYYEHIFNHMTKEKEAKAKAEGAKMKAESDS